MREHAPLVMIGLDALDGLELRSLAGAGGLPNLRKLLDRGEFRRLHNEAPGLIGSVWRSFVNGLPVGEHGWYFRKIWRPDLGRVEVADPSWLRLEPFWQHLCGGPYELAIIDVPHAPPAPPDGFRGVYLNGWQCMTAPRRRRDLGACGANSRCAPAGRGWR